MGVRMVLSDFVPKKKLKLIRIRGRNFCVACEAVFKREKNEASKFILKFEEEIKKKNKHIRNKVLGDTLAFCNQNMRRNSACSIQYEESWRQN